MAIDLEQFHQVFFEESLEGLDIMESSLMELDPSSIDSETVNAIFRSAHSIKGGSATFGFSRISAFTHVLETLLDQVRSGQRGISTQDVSLFLSSVDCMREMLALIQEGGDGDIPKAKELEAEFTAMLSSEPSKADTSTIASSQSDLPNEPQQNNDGSAAASVTHWLIAFTPHDDIFLSGNDPVKNIQALAQLGEITVECMTTSLPALDCFNPEKSYLRWHISLTSSCERSEIEEVFEWIDDICDLDIQIQQDKAEETEVSPTKALEPGQWHIHFIPGLDILRTGNEPSRLFRALDELGETLVESNTERLPDLHSMDSENCYINWHITLNANQGVSEADIQSVFEWVEDESEIIVTQGVKAEISGSVTEPKATLKESAKELLVPRANEAAVSVDAVKKKTGSNYSSQVQNKKPTKKTAAETTSIRVGIDKVDNLINMVGELVITQSMLGQIGSEFDVDRIPKLIEGLGQLEQNTRELQESVMKIRMLPISFAFSRFPRMVRDLGLTLGKSVEIEMRGENTELDKTVMEKIGDPLVHLVRNAVDHGIELPEERASKGKDPSGKITLNAFHQSGNVVIEIIDDGKGLDRQRIINKAIENGIVTEKELTHYSDEQVYDLIFQPGFSTADEVSDVSGRGVGMDVVKRNIQALSGVVDISSKKDEGSKITIKLPLTLAILDGQLVRVGSNTYIFPLVSIIESLQCQKDSINRVAGGSSVFKLRDDYVPIIELHKSFSIRPDSTNLEDSLLVVVESDGEKVGIVVDELLGQQQVVIKSLEQNYKRVNGVSGATILGDGTVALILDIPGIIKLSLDQIGLSTEGLGAIIHQHEIIHFNQGNSSQSAMN